MMAVIRQLSFAFSAIWLALLLAILISDIPENEKSFLNRISLDLFKLSRVLIAIRIAGMIIFVTNAQIFS